MEEFNDEIDLACALKIECETPRLTLQEAERVDAGQDGCASVYDALSGN